MRKPVEVLDFKSFCNGNNVILNEKEVKKEERYQQIGKLALKVGIVSAFALSGIHLSSTVVMASGGAVAAAASGSAEDSWENLIEKLLGLLDPLAKIFGMIAGVAIMTGNGKIGLERLFWLSVGYITTRKVDDWISFLNTI